MTFHDITPQTHPELFIPGTSFLKPIIDIIFKLLMSQNPRALKKLAKGLSHATIAEHLEISESELATLLAIANTTQTS
jgi:DNA-binding NarL/FixJ family response regulator